MGTITQHWVKKLLVCTECVYAAVFMIVLLIVLLVSAWAFAAGHRK